MNSIHTSVLLQESIEGLNLKDNSLFIDATFGGGGHTKLILEKTKNTKVIALDQDMGALNRALSKLGNLKERVIFKNLNFRNIAKSVDQNQKISGILFDLGISSDQLDNSKRGFSFLRDEELLMTLKQDLTKDDLTAKEIVNTWAEESLADIIYGYGEERYARRIAKAIVSSREEKEIKTTFDLVEIIKNIVPKSYLRMKINPATKTFQALRIATNDELRALEEGLENGFNLLDSGGRLVVITFHSLEDRIVKNFFRNKAKEKKGILINKKPIIPTEEEIKNNKRSRSAKLRIIEKL